jgi:hypothetical protein
VTFSVDQPEERSRLTTFFRLFTALPHFVFLFFYAIAVAFAVLFAWFAIVFTAKFPEGLYDFIEGYQRYAARVYAYFYLATDGFPPFSGNPDQPYNAHWNIGPPLEKYSRWKTFFRGILIIPFYIVAYVLTIIYEVVAFIAWFVIVITGKQPKGLQDALLFGLSYVLRLNAYYSLMTEDWPVYWTDDAVDDHLASLGYSGAAAAAPPFESAPPAPPEPPTPPAPPAPPAV